MITEPLERVSPEEEVQDVASGIHGAIGSIINAEIFNYLRKNPIGWVFIAQTDFTLPNIGNRKPDVSYISKEKLPKPTDEEIPYAPDLAVEVISRTDDFSEVVAKAKLYLQAGSQLVWVVDPYNPSVFVYQPNQPTQMLSPNDTLDGQNVLPGFKLPVGELFI